jgi:hypothetical protein
MRNDALNPTDPEYPYFGGCPVLVGGIPCGGNDGYLNLERTHFVVCDRHRMRWRIGENLFSSWQDESPAVWLENASRLDSYRDFEPVHGRRPSA